MKALLTIAITAALYIGQCTADVCEIMCEAEEVCLAIENGTCVNRSELVFCDFRSESISVASHNNHSSLSNNKDKVFVCLQLYNDNSSVCYKGHQCCKSQLNITCIPEEAVCCEDGYCEENHECCGTEKCCLPGYRCFANTCIRVRQPGPLPTRSVRPITANTTPKTRMTVSRNTTTRTILFRWWYGGIAVAGLVLFTALVAIVCFLRKRKTRRSNEVAAYGQQGQASPQNMQSDAVFFVSRPGNEYRK